MWLSDGVPAGTPTAGAGPALPRPQRWRSYSRICSGDQVSPEECRPLRDAQIGVSLSVGSTTVEHSLH